VKNKMECSICGDAITGWGNNPEPFSGESCCDDCNDRFVVPVRMCLGRNFSDGPILTLLVTIAELGKALCRVSVAANQLSLRVVTNNGESRTGDSTEPA